jgi:hypothetical protein
VVLLSALAVTPASAEFLDASALKDYLDEAAAPR